MKERGEKKKELPPTQPLEAYTKKRVSSKTLLCVKEVSSARPLKTP
jgi:hypothetical protein